MKFVTAILVALVALVGMSAAVIDSNTVAANGNAQGASNSMGVSIYTGSGGYGGYPYYYDYYYYGYPYGGYGGYTNVNVYASQTNIVDNTQVAANVAIGGQDGADGADGSDGAAGADGQSGDNVPAADTSAETTAAEAPVVQPAVAVSANGMTIVDGGESLIEEQLDLQTPLEYVTYPDYNVLVVETRGVPTDVAQKFGVAAITNHGYRAVYFVQGLIVYGDGSTENKSLDLSTPPRVARALGYL